MPKLIVPNRKLRIAANILAFVGLLLLAVSEVLKVTINGIYGLGILMLALVIMMINRDPSKNNNRSTL